MTNSEKITLLQLLQEIKPFVSIEIGTKKGGSLQLISDYSKKVYSLDIDPDVELSLNGKFKNVDFIIGDSKQTLPILLEKLIADGITPNFILIDGDHSYEGVKNDINNIIKSKQLNPLTVLMHDSFNPNCRLGMLEAEYEQNKNIQYIDIDFIQGIYSPSPLTRGEMWGGFGLIYFNPESIKKNVEIKQSFIYSYERMFNLSKHKHFNSQSSFPERIRSYIFKKIYL